MQSNRIIVRSGLRALAMAAGLAALALPAGSAAADSSGCSQSGSNVTCTYTAQGESQFVVPAGVSSLTATVVGAQGQGPGGLGAEASGTLAVTPGATLYAEVDVLGASGYGDRGGGESDLRTCSATGTCASGGTLDSRLLVAGGGGGGGGGGSSPDAAGGNAGTTGAAGSGSPGPAGEGGAVSDGGTGATQSAPGTGGAQTGNSECWGGPGSNGGFGTGGNGGGTNGCVIAVSGGGGGGGWYGGGGGGAGLGLAAGGGGGSSYADPSVTGASFSQASAGEAPSVTISYVLPDTTPPSDQPVISGTQGQNGWYTSDVTVAWNWTDSGSGVNTADCTQSSTSSGEGSVTLSASCADLAGNVGSDSVTVKIDTTPPTVSCTSPAPVFALGATGSVTAAVSDATSGPAQATVSATADTSSAGVKTVSLTGQDNAGNSTSVTCPYTVGYGFGGFTAPLPKSTLTRSGSTIPVKFTLTDGSGHPIAPSTAAALASAGQVKATLTGPGISPQSVQCSWDSSDQVFQCNIKTPSGLKTGTANPYTITASENLGGGCITAPVVGAAVNPDTLYFK